MALKRKNTPKGFGRAKVIYPVHSYLHHRFVQDGGGQGADDSALNLLVRPYFDKVVLIQPLPAPLQQLEVMQQLDGPLQLDVTHQLEGPLSLLDVPPRLDVRLQVRVFLQQLHVPIHALVITLQLDALLLLDETLQLQAILKLQVPSMLILEESRRVAICMHSLDPAEARQNVPGNVIQVKC